MLSALLPEVLKCRKKKLKMNELCRIHVQTFLSPLRRTPSLSAQIEIQSVPGSKDIDTNFSDILTSNYLMKTCAVLKK